MVKRLKPPQKGQKKKKNATKTIHIDHRWTQMEKERDKRGIQKKLKMKRMGLQKIKGMDNIGLGPMGQTIRTLILRQLDFYFFIERKF